MDGKALSPIKGTTTTVTKSFGPTDASAPPLMLPSNPMEMVWGAVQLPVTMLPAPSWMFLTKDNICSALFPIMGFIPCWPSKESKEPALLVDIAVALDDSTKDINWVRLATGSFVTITVTGNDLLAGFGWIGWYLKVTDTSVSPNLIPLSLTPSTMLIPTMFDREETPSSFLMTFGEPKTFVLLPLFTAEPFELLPLTVVEGGDT